MLILTIILISAIGAHSRSIDENENSVEKVNHFRLDQDWIKMTKAPPTKAVQTFGSPVEITCEVMGSQVPTIQWIVGNMPLIEMDSFDSNSISETSSSAIVRLKAIHVVDQILTEPRTYTCIGRTGSKTVYASTIVYPQSDLQNLIQLKDKPLIGKHKPRIVYIEKMHLEYIGSNIMLPCKVHGRPQANIYWMDGDGKIIDKSSRLRVLPTGDLLISNLKWEDMGSYKCIAKNENGKDYSDTFVYPVLREDS